MGKNGIFKKPMNGAVRSALNCFKLWVGVKRKSPETVRFQDFALICDLRLRYGRESHLNNLTDCTLADCMFNFSQGGTN